MISPICLLPWLPLVLAVSQVPLSGGRSSPFTPSFDKLVAKSLDRWHTPGFAVAVVDGDETFSKVCHPIRKSLALSLAVKASES